jgi:cyclic beta-1,2-glucan synthetase
VAVETLLGLRLERGDTLIIAPRIPDRWPGYELTYRPPGGESEYRIVADNPAHAAEQVVHAWLDGQPLPVRGQELRVPLTPGRHEVAIRLGRVTG